MTMINAPARAIVRIVLIVVAVAVMLYVLYLLRKPIGWVLVAGYLAVALNVVPGAPRPRPGVRVNSSRPISLPSWVTTRVTGAAAWARAGDAC